MMNKEYDGKKTDVPTQADETFRAVDYVWATSEEPRRNALSLHLIGSIVHRHGGTVTIDAETNAVNIDVPDEEKLACAEELSKKVGMPLQ